MKNYLFTFLLLQLGYSSFAQDFSVTYYYYNPYLNSSVSPAYYPTNMPGNRINIIAPLSCNLGDIQFPGIAIQAANLNSPTYISISSYNSYTDLTHKDPGLTKATHNAVIGQIQQAILDETIKHGCKGVASITVSAAKKWLVGFCSVAETPPTVVACAVGTALKNAIVQKQTQKLVQQGCEVTAKYISKELIEITIETTKDLNRSIEEAKFWLGYINSVDGMIWLMNNIK